MKKSASARSTRRAKLTPIASTQLASAAGGRPDDGEVRNIPGVEGLYFCWEVAEEYNSGGRVVVPAGTKVCTPYPFSR